MNIFVWIICILCIYIYIHISPLGKFDHDFTVLPNPGIMVSDREIMSFHGNCSGLVNYCNLRIYIYIYIHNIQWYKLFIVHAVYVYLCYDYDGPQQRFSGELKPPTSESWMGILFLIFALAKKNTYIHICVYTYTHIYIYIYIYIHILWLFQHSCRDSLCWYM